MLMLCEDRIGAKSYTHLIEPEYAIKDKDLPGLQADLERLSNGEPIQYVLGWTEFCSLRFSVNKDVLIPRPETEILCMEAIKFASRLSRMREAYGKQARPVRILDLCTGSGCIAWTIAINVPGAEVVAVDKSEAAINVAKSQNFTQLIKEKGVVEPKFICASILDEELPGVTGEFDIVVSNPPYVLQSQTQSMRVNVLNYEPSMALFPPNDNPLVFYKAIARWSSVYLSPEGSGITEINEVLGPETKRVFLEGGFPKTEIINDLAKKSRFVLYSR